MPIMTHNDESRPGLIQVEINGADEETVLRAAQQIAGLWLSSGPGRVRRVPGEDGVRVTVWADTHRTREEGGLDIDMPHPAEPGDKAGWGEQSTSSQQGGLGLDQR
ncbi:hypothetical protein GCM10020367_21100 [Streptomyces sannanensis]|uniref:Acyl-CoA carboxylase subunit epsilon n=1 Tax=Streptomyces sannanensis TaxID=285536 RepID=A0ABP6S9M1_9ACTN